MCRRLLLSFLICLLPCCSPMDALPDTGGDTDAALESSLDGTWILYENGRAIYELEIQSDQILRFDALGNNVRRMKFNSAKALRAGAAFPDILEFKVSESRFFQIRLDVDLDNDPRTGEMKACLDSWLYDHVNELAMQTGCRPMIMRRKPAS